MSFIQGVFRLAKPQRLRRVIGGALATILLGHMPAVGQREFSVWDIGSGYRLDVSGKTPRVITYSHDSATFYAVPGWWSGTEAGATISTPCGNYLFGSRGGLAIANEAGQPIEGGNPLDTLNPYDSSARAWIQKYQRFLIVPQPLSRTCYWVFAYSQIRPNFQPLRYHVVDMAANNDAGRVVRKAVGFTRNPTRLVTATQHANRKDFWVMTRDVLTREYLAYRLSERGLDTVPVRSPGLYTPDSVGLLRFSADGTRLAAPSCHTDTAGRMTIMQCLARFEPSTGRVRDELVLKTQRIVDRSNGYQNGQFRGGEFSPSGRFFYLQHFWYSQPDCNNSSCSTDIWQYDLAAGSPDQISRSAYRVSLGSGGGAPLCGLQLTPTGLLVVFPLFGDPIYQHWLPVIRRPDTPGSGCDFQQQAIQIPLQSVGASPNVINSMLLDTVAEIRHLGGCGTASDTVQLWLANPGCAAAVRWDFGDPASGAANTTTEWFPRHPFSEPGTYRVTATTDDGRTFARLVPVDAATASPAPNIFTPNADGLNDTFRPVMGVGDETNYHFRVFNRWGTEVFATTDPVVAWTGAGLGEGVYFYHVNARDCAGQAVV